MRALIAAAVLIAALPGAWAQAGQWTLVQSIGEVSVEEPGVSKIAVKPNARLNEGATITTGPNGRAILTDGRSSITVSASSRLELPAANDESVTSIRQDFGTAVFKVQKKPTAHFEVQTPYLAAVVKGTTFEVTVDAMGATVDVAEGLVDVGANLSGERTLVPGGERVRVLRSGRFEGHSPARLDRGRETVAALNVIAVEIAPDVEDTPERSRDFAALQPHFDRRNDPADRLLSRDRDRDGAAPPPPQIESRGGSDSGGVSVAPPEPLRNPPVLVEPTSSGGRADDDDDARDDDDDRNDRTKWAAFLEKLKTAYENWHARERDDDDRDDRDSRDDDD